MNNDYTILLNYPVYQLRQILRELKLEKKFKTEPLAKIRKKDLIRMLIKYEYDLSKLPQIVKKEAPSKNVLRKYKVKSYTDEEQEKFTKENYYKVENPLEAKGKYFNIKTSTEEELKLQQHQKHFVQHFFISNTTGSIVFHGVGTGKTITAVVASHYYLELYPEGRVIIISPPSLILNFVEGLKQYGLNI